MIRATCEWPKEKARRRSDPLRRESQSAAGLMRIQLDAGLYGGKALTPKIYPCSIEMSTLT